MVRRFAYLLNHLIRLQDIQRCSKMISDHKGGAPLMTLLHIQPQIDCPAKPINPINEYSKEQMLSLYKYCLSLTGHVADAEDLMQDTFLKILSARQKGLPISEQEAYTIRTARNTWVDTTRRRTYFNNYIEQYPLLLSDSPAQPCPQDIELAVQQLMDLLSPWQQAVFMLRDLFGYSAAETAQRLETTEGAVKAALYRARTILAQNSDCKDESIQLAEDAEILMVLHHYVHALYTGDADQIVQLTLMRMNKATQDVHAVATNLLPSQTEHSSSSFIPVGSNAVHSFALYHKQSYQLFSSQVGKAA